MSFASFEKIRVGDSAIHLGRRGHTLRFFPVPLSRCVFTFSSFEVILLCTTRWGQTHDPSTSAHPPVSALQNLFSGLTAAWVPRGGKEAGCWLRGRRQCLPAEMRSAPGHWRNGDIVSALLSLLRQLRATLHRQPTILQAYPPVTHSRQKEDWGDASVGTG